jgi:hypothetical protein
MQKLGAADMQLQNMQFSVARMCWLLLPEYARSVLPNGVAKMLKLSKYAGQSCQIDMSILQE